LGTQIAGVCLFTVAVIVLSMGFPHAVLASESNRNGTIVTFNGMLHFVYGSEACAGQPHCISGQSVIAYLAVGNGENYILVGGKADVWPDGQMMVVTGWLAASSGSASSLAFAGDIIVTNIFAHCHMHNSG